MTVHSCHIRQLCYTESFALQMQNSLSSGVVKKWSGHQFWVRVRAVASTELQAISLAINKRCFNSTTDS